MIKAINVQLSTVRIGFYLYLNGSTEYKNLKIRMQKVYHCIYETGTISYIMLQRYLNIKYYKI